MDNHNNNPPNRNFKNELTRIISEVALFLLKLAVAALFLLIDWGIKRLSAIVLENPDGIFYNVLAFVLDTTFIGTAMVISITGAIAIVAEFIKTTIDHINELRKK